MQEKDFEQIARTSHRNGTNCARSVYDAFSDVNTNKTTAPMPRSDGGKCGAVLSAMQVIKETDAGDPQTIEDVFLKEYGSVKCAELRGFLTGRCNDYVGLAAKTVAEMIGEV